MILLLCENDKILGEWKRTKESKDLTKLMGGVFEISIDGDIFKASVLLDRA